MRVLIAEDDAGIRDLLHDLIVRQGQSVTLARDGREYGAKLTGDQGSAILKSMVRADGLAVVAPDTIVPAGDRVEVIVLRALEPRVLGG